MISKPKILVIVGPTASGKSGLAIKLAGKFNGEIISADSRQVYRGLDISSGKVSNKEQGRVKHYLLDVASPKNKFTADNFKKLGQKAIKEIIKKGKLPIIVGGTGFYIDSLLGRVSLIGVPPNKKLRAKLEKHSTEQLFKQLQKLDPARAGTIDRYNKRRLVRALEIIMVTGKPVPKITGQTSYDILWIGLNPENLNAKIEKRLHERLKKGMVNEIKKLHKQGVSWKRLDELGLECRYISKYLRGSLTKDEMTNQLLSEIKKYSKRQMTWFKRNKEIHWINPSTIGQSEKLVKRFLN